MHLMTEWEHFCNEFCLELLFYLQHLRQERRRAGICSGREPDQQMPSLRWNLDRKPLRRALPIGAFPFPCSCSSLLAACLKLYLPVAHPWHGAPTSLSEAHTPTDNPDQFTSVYLAARYCALTKYQKSLWLIRIRLIPADCLSLCKKGTRG